MVLRPNERSAVITSELIIKTVRDDQSNTGDELVHRRRPSGEMNIESKGKLAFDPRRKRKDERIGESVSLTWRLHGSAACRWAVKSWLEARSSTTIERAGTLATQSCGRPTLCLSCCLKLEKDRLSCRYLLAQTSLLSCSSTPCHDPRNIEGENDRAWIRRLATPTPARSKDDPHPISTTEKYTNDEVSAALGGTAPCPAAARFANEKNELVHDERKKLSASICWLQVRYRPCLREKW